MSQFFPSWRVGLRITAEELLNPVSSPLCKSLNIQ
jgi:hypothetical protein